MQRHGDQPQQLSPAVHPGRAYNQGSDEIHTHIPAGQTVTRTVKFEKDPDALTNPKLLVAVGYYEAIEDMHISIKAVQFSK